MVVVPPTPAPFERILDPDSVPDERFGLILSRLVVGLLTDLGDGQ